jgi:quaternary ammonium compound-resistance protein SugE
VEVAWSQSIKPTAGFTRPLLTLLCFALVAVAVAVAVDLLSLAMKGLPVGTAYAVFTGIGAADAITLGIVVHKDPLPPGRLLALALVIGGVALSHANAPAE